MVKLSKQTTMQVQARTIQIFAKVSDAGAYTLLDQNAQIIHDCNGYVPSWFPGDHRGDYVILDIDIETGYVTNWKTPNTVELERWIDENP